MPAPAPGTNPEAEALIGLEAACGSSLKRRDNTRMASKPAQVYWLAPSTPPQSMRFARPARMRSRPMMTASVPLLHALELLVTWLPSAKRPAIRADTPLPITCSTTVLPSRRTRPESVSGTTLSPTVSSPPTPVPMIAPQSQSTWSSSSFGRAKPASRQASTAAIHPKRWLEFMARRSSSSK